MDPDPSNRFRMKGFRDRYSQNNYLVTEQNVDAEKAKNYFSNTFALQEKKFNDSKINYNE